VTDRSAKVAAARKRLDTRLDPRHAQGEGRMLSAPFALAVIAFCVPSFT
jgi:hypothetical protein